MGQPFQMSYTDTAIGLCELCGLSMKGPGLNTGRVTTIGYDCAEKIARIVNSRSMAETLGRVDPGSGPVSIEAQQAASEAGVSRARRARQAVA